MPYGTTPPSSPQFQKQTVRPVFENSKQDAFIPIAKKIDTLKTINVATVKESVIPKVQAKPKMTNSATNKPNLSLKSEDTPKANKIVVIDEPKVKAEEKPKENNELRLKEPKVVNVEGKSNVNSEESKATNSEVKPFKTTCIEEKPSKVKEMLKRAEIFERNTVEVKSKPIVEVPERKFKVWDSNKSTERTSASINETKHVLKPKSNVFARDQNAFHEAKQKLALTQQNKSTFKAENKMSIIDKPVKRGGLVVSFIYYSTH
jgi:hypothetical protein